MPTTEWLNKYEAIKNKLTCKDDLEAHFTEKVIGNMAVDVPVSYTHLDVYKRQVTARDPESGEEFVIFDGGRHGYDNMFCDEHDPSELEHRPLKRYEIPASKLVLELGYSIDYEDEKENFEPDEADTVELINGERMPWEQAKRDGIDYIALYYVNEKGKPVQILDAELA